MSATTITKNILIEIKKVLGSVANDLTEETVDLGLKVGQQVATGKARLMDVLQIPKQHMEVLYATAYSLYERDKYQEAQKIFLLLCTYDPIEVKYWEGLGATQKLLKQYKEASASYFILTQLDPFRIVYFLELAKCLLGQNMNEGAMQCCEAVIFMANDPTFAPANKDAVECAMKAKQLLKTL